MIGRQDSIIEKIYREIKHVIDDIYIPKGISSENIKKYFSIKKNFKKLVGHLTELRHSYDETRFKVSFEEKVRDILFDRILMDRIYFERDNPKNESILSYSSFIKENHSDLDPYGEEEWEEDDKGELLYAQIRALDDIYVETNSGLWKFYYDGFDGCVNWWNDVLKISIYATPYYNNKNNIPIEASDNEGYQNINDEIKLGEEIITLEEYKTKMVNWINNHSDFFIKEKKGKKKCYSCGKDLQEDEISYGVCKSCRWNTIEKQEDILGGF
jgi:hypothetical protein